MKKWIENVAIPFIEKWWRPIAIFVLIVVGLLIGKRVVGKVVDGIFGKVRNGSPFTPIAGDPAHVVVPTGKGPQVIKLPSVGGKQITSDQVQSVGYAPGYLAKVEMKSAATNRR